jgi:hypothetical protein
LYVTGFATPTKVEVGVNAIRPMDTGALIVYVPCPVVITVVWPAANVQDGGFVAACAAVHIRIESKFHVTPVEVTSLV